MSQETPIANSTMSFAHERSYIVAARLAVACESPSASRTAHITAKNVMANIISESAGYLTGHRNQQALVLVFSHVLKQPPIQKFATNVFRAATINGPEMFCSDSCAQAEFMEL